MSLFTLHSTPLSGLLRVERNPTFDSRGFFTRLYCAEAFRAAGCKKAVAQINHTLTRVGGAVRGLHFQYPPYAEVKLVSCLRGEIFDVAVDLRQGSPTFLQWHGEVLSAENRCSLLVPEGFAHGFQALTKDCELIYLHTEPFNAESEGALNATDPRIAVSWPLAITERSDRDRGHPLIGAGFAGVQL